MILQIDTGSALKLSFAILILSFGLASPISIYSRIIYLFDNNSIPASFKSPAFCVEDFSRSWKVMRTVDSPHVYFMCTNGARGIYSTFIGYE